MTFVLELGAFGAAFNTRLAFPLNKEEQPLRTRIYVSTLKSGKDACEKDVVIYYRGNQIENNELKLLKL